MSLLNSVAISPECVLVAVDSEGISHGFTFEVSKLLVLPHMNATLAARGVLKTFADIHGQLVCSIGNFDALAAYLPGAIGEAVAATVQAAPSLGLTTDEASKFECLFAGWSEKHQRVVVHHYRQTSKAEGVIANLAAESVLSPWEPEDSLEGISQDRQGLMELALRQVSSIRERHPGKAGGGRLIIAEVRRGSVRIEHAMQLPSRSAGYPDAGALISSLTMDLGEAISEAMR
jgi:hypothetical protein